MQEWLFTSSLCKEEAHSEGAVPSVLGQDSEGLDSLMGRRRASLVQHVCWTLPV